MPFKAMHIVAIADASLAISRKYRHEPRGNGCSTIFKTCSEIFFDCVPRFHYKLIRANMSYFVCSMRLLFNGNRLGRE